MLSGDLMRVGANTTERFLASILLADFIICTLRAAEREGERVADVPGNVYRQRHCSCMC